MNADVLRLDLRLRRRILIGTAVGAAAYLFLIVAMYPSFKHDTSLDAMIAANPTAAAAFGVTGSITSPAGWLNANMYANFAPLLALLLTIGYGAAAIAGQDADGTLGMVANTPLSRLRLLGQKATALLLVSLVVPVASYAACLPGPHFGLDPGWGRLAGISLAVTLLAFDLGALALLVGAATGSRGAALGVASAVAGAAYLVASLAPVVSAFHRIRWLSPFTWAVGSDHMTGVTIGEAGALLGLGVLLVAASVPALERLDIH